MIFGKEFRHMQLNKPDFLKTNTLPDKKGPAHAVHNHAGKTVAELIDRKLERNENGQAKDACSSFADYDALQKNIVNCILLEEDRLDRFLKNSPDKTRIVLSGKIPKKADWGTVIYKNKEKDTLETGLSNNITVILQKAEERDLGFYIVTAYSDMNHLKETQPDLTDEMPKTQAWRYASTPRKMGLYRTALPDPAYSLRKNPGSDNIYLLDANSNLCCIFTRKDTYICRLDKEENPIPYGMLKNRENPYVSFYGPKLQSFLQKSHPQFYADVLKNEEIYRGGFPKSQPILQKSSVTAEKETENLKNPEDAPDHPGPSSP